MIWRMNFKERVRVHMYREFVSEDLFLLLFSWNDIFCNIYQETMSVTNQTHFAR